MTVGEIEITNDGTRDDWLERYWDGRSFTLLIGSPGWAKADFRPLLSGTLAGIAAAGPARLVWQVRDNRALLDVPAQPNTYPDTSTSSPNEGAPKPLALGFCFNVEPVWIPPDGSIADIAADLEYDPNTGIVTATTATSHGYAVGDAVEVYGTTDSGYQGVFVVASTPTGTTLTYDLGSILDLEPDAGTLFQASLTYQVHDGEIQEIVTIRDSSGEPLDPGDYAVNLTAGTFALGVQPVGGIRVDVKGAKHASAFAQTAATITRYLFAHAGLSSSLLDSDNLDAWAIACPHELGLYIRDARQLGDVLSEINATLDAHAPFSRAGKLGFWRRAEPSGSAAVEFGVGDIVLDSLFPADPQDIVYKIAPRYRRNWAALPEDATAGSGLPPVLKRQLAQEYRVAVYSHPDEADILAAHPLARDLGQVDFLFSAQTPSTALSRATTEAGRRISLYGVQRYAYRLSVYSAPGRVDVGDEVLITHPRFGFGLGLGAIVLEINERPSNGEIDLMVWR
jgi:hypothetical protein